MGEKGYCLVEGSRIVGSAIATERGEVAYLWGLYVLPTHQRSGAGSRLLAAVAHDIAIATVVEVRVLTSSRPALAFYRARGFRDVGQERTEIMPGVDASALVLEADVARLRSTSG